MEFKGTKGKWEVVDSGIKQYTNIICGDIRIAEVKHYNDPEDLYNKLFLNDPVFLEGKANAKLIAAAPEMFDMLKLILNERVSNHYFKIQQLLTKITE